MKNNSLRAFTLIEILVVVAILIALIALVIPSISSAMARATTATDINKLKQIGIALATFAADNGGRLPHAGKSAEKGVRLPSPVPEYEPFVWAEAVDRYFEQLPDFWSRTSYNWLKRPNSPFFSKACDPYPGFSPSSQYPLWKRPLAFSYNKYLNDERWEGYVNRIPQPAQTVIVAEVNGVNTIPMSPDQPPKTQSNVQATYRVSRPGNTALYLFADYHVETLVGDRGMTYFAANPHETNIWRWW